MAKLRSTPITAADLAGYLKADDDFAFELRCLHALSKRPVALEHGGTYADPVTGKTRQFDIRVKLEVDQLRVSLAVECKNLSPSYPLLVSRVPRIEGEAFHHLLIPDERHEDVDGGQFTVRMPKLSWTKSIPVDSPKSLYEVGGYVGKSVTRVGIADSKAAEYVSDDSEVFDRWSQAVASAYDLMSEADSYFREDDSDPCAYWIVPVLVVPEGTLWVADYEKSGTLLSPPSQTDEVEIYLDHDSWEKGAMFSYTISHLHFVTPAGLLKLVDRLLTNVHFRKRVLPLPDAQT